jgi:hypothetical protein
MNTCTCGEDADKICGACKCAKYCSIECQRADWSEHKLICSQLAKHGSKDIKKFNKWCDHILGPNVALHQKLRDGLGAAAGMLLRIDNINEFITNPNLSGETLADADTLQNAVEAFGVPLDLAMGFAAAVNDNLVIIAAIKQPEDNYIVLSYNIPRI